MEEHKSGRRVGYLRVSTDEQRPDRQVDGLESECDELRLELGVSAIARTRPVFDRLLIELEAGDTLVVWALDRAFRSALDAISVAKVLRERGIHLKIVSLHMDTSTPAGRFVYTLLAALAEFERDNLAERTRQGLSAARQRGKTLGRPFKLGTADIAWARTMLDTDSAHTITGLAQVLGCSRKTLSRALSAEH